MRTIVTVIQDNILQELIEFNTPEEAESAFADLVIFFEDEQPADDELNGALEEGRWECHNTTITIGQPLHEEDATMLEVVRKSNNRPAMKKVILSYHETVTQDVEGVYYVPEHLAELGGNPLREWIQENDAQPVSTKVLHTHGVHDDLQDMIVKEIE